MTTMGVHSLTITFHTPAFLGNAGQCGRWRTPLAQLHQGISSVERNTA